MKTRERFVIYSLLALLAISQGVMLLATGAGNAAWAGARALFDELGPATAVRLTDEKNTSAPEVVLRNSNGKLSFGEEKGATAYSIGFVHIGKALGQLMDSSSMKDERDRLDEEFADKEEDLRTRINAFQEEHKDLKPDDPNIEEVRQAYGALMQEAQALGGAKMTRRDALLSEQMERAYRDLVAAVDVVSDRNKIDIVYRFIPVDDDFESDSAAAARDAIRARVALKYPDGLDLTDQVLEELDLDLD